MKPAICSPLTWEMPKSCLAGNSNSAKCVSLAHKTAVYWRPVYDMPTVCYWIASIPTTSKKGIYSFHVTPYVEQSASCVKIECVKCSLQFSLLPVCPILVHSWALLSLAGLSFFTAVPRQLANDCCFFGFLLLLLCLWYISRFALFWKLFFCVAELGRVFRNLALKLNMAYNKQSPWTAVSLQLFCLVLSQT